jgi:VIT1/CCC1 family predicted Fe2+/Mn2+ transporter
MKRHETDLLSLVFGVILMITGLLFVSGRVDAADFVSVWALPAALLATGIVLGAVAMTRYRRRQEP